MFKLKKKEKVVRLVKKPSRTLRVTALKIKYASSKTIVAICLHWIWSFQQIDQTHFWQFVCLELDYVILQRPWCLICLFFCFYEGLTQDTNLLPALRPKSPKFMTSATSFSTTLFHANITVSIREFVAIIFHDFDYGVSGLELAWVPRVPGTCTIFGQHCLAPVDFGNFTT